MVQTARATRPVGPVEPAEDDDRRLAGLRTATKSVLHGVGEATASMRPLPDFLVIGTKRGGTTSLFHYLRNHPDVLPMWPARRLKSPHFFYWHYDRGERWYRAHFPLAVHRRAHELVHRTTTVTGEASPYYLYHPYTAGRVHALIPTVKVVILLRDPVRRAYSHYWERVDNGVEPLEFGAALAAEPHRLRGEVERMTTDPLYYSQAHDWYSYRDRGIYAPQLRRWLDLFPREQLLISSSEQFYADEQAAVDTVTDFLGLRRHQMPSKPRYNHRPARSMDPAVRAELTEFYRPHNTDVYELLGHDFGWSR